MTNILRSRVLISCFFRILTAISNQKQLFLQTGKAVFGLYRFSNTGKAIIDYPEISSRIILSPEQILLSHPVSDPREALHQQPLQNPPA